MTMPMEYALASKEFEAFMSDFMALADMPTHHRAYHSIRAVLHVFRNHLPVKDAMTFASALPPILRAIFVEDWRSTGETPPFPDRKSLLREIKSIHPDHNLAPDTVMKDAAKALRRHVNAREFDRVLAQLPKGAAAFWAAR
jgi:uncharacterized protein (DUF2267 family)